MVTASVVAGEGKLTVLDLIWRGVETVAKAYGILDEKGRVTDGFRDEVELVKMSISKNQKARRAKNAN